MVGDHDDGVMVVIMMVRVMMVIVVIDGSCGNGKC